MQTPAAPETPSTTGQPAAPRLSIIIPCRNEITHIRKCLTSILGQEDLPQDCEILVADGMSEDGTRAEVAAMAQADPRIRLLDNPARTTPHALNIAIRAAQGEVIIRMDAHTVFAADYVSQCLRVLEETGADNVGGATRTRAESYVQRAIAAASHSPFAVGNGCCHRPNYEGWADTIPYGCYRRARLLALGMFDEELIRNQDDELNYRLVQAGGRIWQSPRIRSWYAPRSSWRRLFQQYFQYGYWKVRVIQKRGRAASPRHWAPGGFVALLALLMAAAVLFPPARWAFGALLALYGGGIIVAATLTARRSGWPLFPGLCLAFPCYHFGYGVGFLAGVWDFSFRARTGRYTALSRD